MDDALENLVRTTGGGTYGVTPAGFVPKPVSRLVDEHLAAARVLFGASVDLTSGSALRKLCELMALSDARLWETQQLMFRATSASTAVGDALSAHGAQLGIPRPFLRARTSITFVLTSDLPAGTTSVHLPLGTRVRTPGGADFFLTDPVTLTSAARRQSVGVRSFLPGPGGDVDPGTDGTQKIDRFHPDDSRPAEARALPAGLLVIEHTQAATGGAELLDDESYRALLLDVPRNVWSADALRLAVLRVPGVRQAVVHDGYGGLDIDHTIFGNVSFFERLFSQERDLGSPYFVTVMVAPDVGAVWEGPQGLLARVRSALDAVRPVGILPAITPVTEVFVGMQATVYTAGVPTAGHEALVQRVRSRLDRYVGALEIGEPVRFSEFVWAVMEEPGVADVKDLRLRRSPALEQVSAAADVLDPGADVAIGAGEVATLVLDPGRIEVR